MTSKSAWGIVALVLITFFLIKVLNLSIPLTITTTTKTSELAITGEGKVDVVPDTAYIDAGISVRNAASVQDAQSRVNEVDNKIIVSLQQLGIDKKDIKTSNYSVNPNVVYKDNQNATSGYNADVSIEVKLRNTQLSSRVIEEVTKAGANDVRTARFTIENPEKFREEARNRAIQNAKDQARKLASSLGITLGRVVNIVESSPSAPLPIYGRAISIGTADKSTTPDIETGSQTITSTVTLYFEKN